ncbi:cysteine-rich with EGF-like domain protein 2 isoform X1 [Heterocephalus glaber]|uniref:protein disulfide-isomerase n=1 Tax=Heterocephalus glaber TaxID=10181 RepID=A0AAX6P859_HETGA|nr:cysteine-rich with EGF-like domain protein 2 isoform X1 [Heterocephalus glaber]
MRPPPSAVLCLLLLLLLLLLVLRPALGTARKTTPCQRCRTLVDKFKQGMANTAKKNFGGGNTAWEEKTLSKYEFSEIRLLEIMEGLCESSDFECNQLLEQQEEHLEGWWLQLKKEHPDLFEWFCVQTLEVCCSPGTYGPDCRACQGGSERPCSGNGHCNGDGSRQGDGSCQCHTGYKGTLCTDCIDGYFQSLKTETHSTCTACDESCRTCLGPTNRDCSNCEAGWVRIKDACVDVDECAADAPPCSDTQYCENVAGSYTCEECDSTCVGCTGKGPAKCKECVPGYTEESGQCADIDECSLAEQPCARKNENCYNTPGSFVCVCPDGFEETEDSCVPPAEGETEATGDNPTQSPYREDL